MPFHLGLPLRPSKVGTRLHHHSKEVNAELLDYGFHDEQGNEVEFHIVVDGQTDGPPVYSCWYILDNEVVVVDLGVGLVYFGSEIQFLADFGLVVDGASKEENCFVVFESVVADALEDGLSYGHQGNVVGTVADFVVAGNVLLLSGFLHIRDESVH